VKKFLLLLAAAIIVALGLTGISSAYFSDTEISEGIIITGGTTELQVDGQVDFYFEFDKGTIKQGASGTATIELSNTGSTDGVADLRIMNLVNYENGLKKGEKKVDGTPGEFEGELGAYLLVTITYNGNPVYLPGDGDAVADMPLDNLNGENLILGGLAAQDTRIVEIAWELPGGVGEIIKSDSVSFCTEFSLGW